MAETTITGKRQITLPVEICRAMGLRTGDKLAVLMENGEIRLRPAEHPVFRPLSPESGLLQMIGMASGPEDLAAEHDRYLAEGSEAEG